MSRLSELIAELCPDGVEYKALGEVASFGSGHTPSKADAANYEEGGIWWVTSKDVKTDVLTSTGITLSESGAKRLTLYPIGTLVMVTRSGVLKRLLPIAFLAEPMTVNQDIKAILPNNEIVLSRYLFHFLKASDNDIRERYGKAGGTVDSINFNMVKRYRVPAPPIEVQREVVRILDEYTAAHDELVAQLEHEIEFRESVYEKMRDGILLGGKSDTMHSFKDCCESMNTGPFGSMVHKSDYVSDGCPIVNPADIKDTDVAVGKMVSEEAEHRLARYKLRANDIVIGRRGDMGRIGIIDETTEGYICGTGCFFVRMNGLAISRYWRHLFSTSYAKAYLEAHAVGSTMKNLNLKILGNMPVPVPTLQEQEEIVALLDKYSLLHDDVMHQIRSDISMLNEQLTLLRNHLLSFPEKVS